VLWRRELTCGPVQILPRVTRVLAAPPLPGAGWRCYPAVRSSRRPGVMSTLTGVAVSRSQRGARR
jgi:hypothetical protein